MKALFITFLLAFLQASSHLVGGRLSFNGIISSVTDYQRSAGTLPPPPKSLPPEHYDANGRSSCAPQPGKSVISMVTEYNRPRKSLPPPPPPNNYKGDREHPSAPSLHAAPENKQGEVRSSWPCGKENDPRTMSGTMETRYEGSHKPPRPPPAPRAKPGDQQGELEASEKEHWPCGQENNPCKRSVTMETSYRGNRKPRRPPPTPRAKPGDQQGELEAPKKEQGELASSWPRGIENNPCKKSVAMETSYGGNRKPPHPPPVPKASPGEQQGELEAPEKEQGDVGSSWPCGQENNPCKRSMTTEKSYGVNRKPHRPPPSPQASGGDHQGVLEAPKKEEGEVGSSWPFGQENNPCKRSLTTKKSYGGNRKPQRPPPSPQASGGDHQGVLEAPKKEHGEVGSSCPCGQENNPCKRSVAMETSYGGNRQPPHPPPAPKASPGEQQGELEALEKEQGDVGSSWPCGQENNPCKRSVTTEKSYGGNRKPRRPPPSPQASGGDHQGVLEAPKKEEGEVGSSWPFGQEKNPCKRSVTTKTSYGGNRKPQRPPPSPQASGGDHQGVLEAPKKEQGEVGSSWPCGQENNPCKRSVTTETSYGGNRKPRRPPPSPRPSGGDHQGVLEAPKKEEGEVGSFWPFGQENNPCKRSVTTKTSYGGSRKPQRPPPSPQASGGDHQGVLEAPKKEQGEVGSSWPCGQENNPCKRSVATETSYGGNRKPPHPPPAPKASPGEQQGELEAPEKEQGDVGSSWPCGQENNPCKRSVTTEKSYGGNRKPHRPPPTPKPSPREQQGKLEAPEKEQGEVGSSCPCGQENNPCKRSVTMETSYGANRKPQRPPPSPQASGGDHQGVLESSSRSQTGNPSNEIISTMTANLASSPFKWLSFTWAW